MNLFPWTRKPSKEKPDKVARCRSLPSAYHFRVAVTLSAIHYLSLIAMLTTGILLIAYPDDRASRLLILATATSIGTWFLAFFKRRTTVCPLCKGTPLIASGALVHARARRMPPLNHATSAILSILLFQRFRCMYCGTDYDLLKEPARQRLHPKSKRRFFFFNPKD
jgi:hypothetical protein